MTDRTRTVRALAVASLSVGALVSAPALAGAQAGVDTTTKVVVVDSADIAVTVNAHDGTPDTVTGSIQNRTGTEMKCQGPVGTGDTTGDVTQADIVASAMEYYKQYPWQPPIEVGVAVPVMGTYKIDLGSVETYIPAAIAGYLRPDMGMRREIGDRYTAARLIGQAGQITSLTIPANTSRTWTATLGDPTAAPKHAAPARPRRTEAGDMSARRKKLLASNGVLIDMARREVFLDGQRLGLTFKEFELLFFLVENSSRAVSREELITALWADDSEIPHERTIDVHIRRLRAKLGRLSNAVRTVRGEGYRFYDHPEVLVWTAPEYLI